ncbi:sn-glycerol 3-phosphate transport system permease protein [Halohasta litchfieldiae]|jgi:sn-glycerol 3-phosphate transport system permease protein|uniref:Carbohydrate ABC transporter membrane protein 2, CUT1 family n=1 Tax=Halohasta litchfieldiae TaxID=1073996 RepID=A0A1H6U4E9_9EURY|nr:carbohydrate ABC transporter permease [Halohasta litchfieldiae]ATW89100.1 sn-glycerol 3-phosphate transport system permease protein [Halohasta litchfieldiae]SEI87171.1 carbohydrate ABC transporter membrane protein 2, CUT1 family [Halohasta litchfieldiae]
MIEPIQYTKQRLASVKEQSTAETGFGSPVGVHLQIWLLVFLVVFPIFVALIVSTKPQGIVTSLSDLVPGTYAVENYREAIVDYNFARYMWNSFVMAVIIVVGKLIVSVCAAMAIVYYRVPYKNLVFLFILFTLMLPVPVRFIPLFQLINDLGWGNTLLAITVPYLASATSVFILRQHFLSIPTSIVETAKLDGVGPVKFLFSVLIPMSKGVLVGVSIIMFVYAWNQYLWPLVIIDSQANQVAQVGLSLLEGDVQGGQLSWSLVMAGSMLTLIPPLALMILFRKPLLETFSIQQK